jgi:serine/threonine protein kinase
MLFSHRNIVGVIDGRRCPNGFVLVMEWISRSSRDHPGRSSALARDLIRSPAFQYFDCGKSLSERGIVHRDF